MIGQVGKATVQAVDAHIRETVLLFSAGVKPRFNPTTEESAVKSKCARGAFTDARTPNFVTRTRYTSDPQQLTTRL